jgi:hypothetical protein
LDRVTLLIEKHHPEEDGIRLLAPILIETFEFVTDGQRPGLYEETQVVGSRRHREIKPPLGSLIPVHKDFHGRGFRCREPPVQGAGHRRK